MGRNRLIFGSALLLISCSAGLAQPPIAVPVKPTGAESKAQQPVAPPMSLTELEELIGGRTLLTLKLQNATLEEVATAMSQSSKLEVTVRPMPTRLPQNSQSIPLLIPTQRADALPPTYTPLPAPRFTIEAKEQPFWEALFAWKNAARLADAAALKDAVATPPAVSPDGRNVRKLPTRTPTLSVEERHGEKGLWVSPNGGLPNGRLISTWPVVMVATGITRSQSGQFASDPFMRQNAVAPALANNPAAAAPQTRAMDDDIVVWSDWLSVNLNTFFDPKIKPQGVFCEVLEAIDDRGNDLRPNTKYSRFPMISPIRTISPVLSYGTFDSGASIPINLQPHPAMGRQLKKLRGVLHFTILARSEKWEISDVNAPAQRNIWQDGALFQMRFSGLERADNGWMARFIVEAQGEKAKRFYSNWAPGADGGGYSFSAPNPSGNYNATFVGGEDFGVRGISLADDRGRTFITSRSGSLTRAEGRVTPQKTNLSPPTPRTEKYTYLSEQTVTFSASTDAGGQGLRGITTGAGVTNLPMGMPVKLTLNIPLEKREVTIPFEFTDLPLPPS